MKTNQLTILILVILSLAVGYLIYTRAPEPNGPGAKIGEKIDDALDARPAEGIRDAVEKVTK
jgi:hypothetical protein